MFYALTEASMVIAIEKICWIFIYLTKIPIKAEHGAKSVTCISNKILYMFISWYVQAYFKNQIDYKS